MEKFVGTLKTILGDTLMEKLIEQETILIGDDVVRIEIKRPLDKLYDVCFNIEINNKGKNADIDMCYLTYDENLGKINIIWYDDDDNMLVVDKERIEVKDKQLYIDNKLVDFNDFTNNIYEIDREESFQDETCFDVKDFACFLKTYPFSKKFEEDDGSYYLKSIKMDWANTLLLSAWLKTLFAE